MEGKKSYSSSMRGKKIQEGRPNWEAKAYLLDLMLRKGGIFHHNCNCEIQNRKKRSEHHSIYMSTANYWRKLRKKPLKLKLNKKCYLVHHFTKQYTYTCQHVHILYHMKNQKVNVGILQKVLNMHFSINILFKKTHEFWYYITPWLSSSHSNNKAIHCNATCFS